MSQNAHTSQWMDITCPRFLQIAQETGIYTFMINWYLYKEFTLKVQIPVSFAIIVLFKAKFGASFRVYNCP